MIIRLRRDPVYPLSENLPDTYGAWDLWVTGQFWKYGTISGTWRLFKEYVNEASKDPPARKARAVGKVRA